MPDRITNETDLIQTYLAPLAAGAPGAFGLLDDAALLSVPPGLDLVVSTDPIIAGVHFFPGDRADDVAWKALAVNASDLAAKGAAPIAYTLALAFPEPPQRAWMESFAQGLAVAQLAFGMHLIGGDTDRTTGPLSIGVTALGATPSGSFVKRAGAVSGDRIFLTGTLGDSALGLKLHRDPRLFGAALTDGDRSFLLGRYLRPSPRIELIEALREHARAALDVSDGFLKDAARLAGSSGARIEFSRLPLSPSARLALAHDPAVAELALSGGDDYEILAAIPPAAAAAFMAQARAAGILVTDVGEIGGADEIEVFDAEGRRIKVAAAGYDHFSRRD